MRKFYVNIQLIYQKLIEIHVEKLPKKSLINMRLNVTTAVNFSFEQIERNVILKVAAVFLVLFIILITRT